MQDNESEQPPKAPSVPKAPEDHSASAAPEAKSDALDEDVPADVLSSVSAVSEDVPHTEPASLPSEAAVGPKPEGNGSKPEAKSWRARHPWLSRIAIGFAVVA
ncbi:MAG: hypothetical protein AAF405_08980, partial [Pseudomonadota bacterium]